MKIIDVETRPQENLIQLYNKKIEAPKNYKDEAKIAEFIEKKKADSVKAMSTDTDYADILCIGVYDTELNGGTAYIIEPNKLESLFTEKEVIITFNGKKFDIPVIIKYGIKHDLNLPYPRLRGMLRRWNSDGHIDLMEELGQGDFRSLDEYMQIYLGESKTPIDFENASDQEIKDHCLEDVINTHKLFQRFQRLFI